MATNQTKPIITFATAWYDLGAKFAKEQYYVWAGTLLKNVRKFNLVVYVEDADSAQLIRELSANNSRVYIIIFPFNDLPLYRTHGPQFEFNHMGNVELNGRVSWKLVLLWCSKQFFVENTENHMGTPPTPGFPNGVTNYYGWMDIGYFRSRGGKRELTGEQIREYPNSDRLRTLMLPTKIHYGLVNPAVMETLKGYASRRDAETGLPKIPIPSNQISVAGGFFILGSGGPSRIWREQFETHLFRYFAGSRTIKDDQYILIDLILLNPMVFQLWVESPQTSPDPWFLFQRLLM
jgi:hypothetical protein